MTTQIDLRAHAVIEDRRTNRRLALPTQLLSRKVLSMNALAHVYTIWRSLRVGHRAAATAYSATTFSRNTMLFHL
jgi:hypothetical protein